MSGAAYDLGEIVDKFNESINKLLDIVDDCAQDKVTFTALRKKITLVMNTDPVFLLDSAGKYVYKYREVITTGGFGDFVMNTEKYILSDDKEAVSNEAKGKSEGEVDFAKSIVEQLRHKWTNFSDPERKQSHKIVKRMLSEYCKYLTYLIK